jgi:16S rRNA processing protein RimM
VSQAATRPALPNEKRGSGGQRRAPEPRFLVIGKVVGAHGIRGELKVLVLSDDPHRYERLQRAFVGRDAETPQPWSIRGTRLHKGYVLLKLEGCETRADAETFRGCLVQVPLDEAMPLQEGAYYEHQIIGLAVWTASGEWLGDVDEIIFTGANEVYVAHGAGRREILIPAIESVVLKVDLEAGRLVVDLPAELS